MDAEMSVSYDRQSDVLYLSYGETREAISEENEDGVLVRRDPRSNTDFHFLFYPNSSTSEMSAARLFTGL